MKLKRLLDYLTVIAVLTNCIEKLTSYIGQKMFPIYEGNVWTAMLIQKVGLEAGHVIPLLASIIAIIFLRYIAIVVPPQLERHPRIKAVASAIPIAALIYIITVTFYVAANNIYLIWISIK